MINFLLREITVCNHLPGCVGFDMVSGIFWRFLIKANPTIMKAAVNTAITNTAPVGTAKKGIILSCGTCAVAFSLGRAAVAKLN